VRLITAIIKPHKLNDVRDAMRVVGVHGMTITEARGHGRQRGHAEVYRGAEYRVDLLPKLRVEIVVEDLDVRLVVEALRSSAQTGKIGDGKIWVSPVETLTRVRTGEWGLDAL
jgi:nitrogen regulatory protein P-II 1